MAELRVKTGVQPQRLITILAAIANEAQRLQSPAHITITSVIDGVHGPDSLHYALRAVDVRSHNFATISDKQEFKKALETRLGPGYQVLLEHVGEANEHFHIEFDPRRV